ncbi:DUF5004 domain-containing protein [Gelidibacter salicanalis]|uniref:DUF5004 domain-containing protein n=1 Tax=Gelidibacter salicanalis TaxID=291193 RepID=A0A934NDY1_9FLAO|nr:DUF5004 domain-containing protein [Gelidibacter salicanalis]MBJ7882150.1 hypothetical protein [Gelidibacter salicanalis]
MKTITYSLLLSIALIFTNCSPDNEGTHGTIVDRSEQLTGTWSIETVSQIDLDAEKKGFPDFATRVDITNAISGMPFTDFTLQIGDGTLSTTVGNSPMSYVISEGTGTWTWNSDDTVNLVNQQLGINASSGIETIINGNTVLFLIKTYAGITGDNQKLSLNYERLDASGNAVTRYEYILAKQ